MAKNRRYMMDEDFDEKDRIDDNDIDDYYVQEAPVKRSRKSNKNKRSAGIIAAVIVVCVLVAGGMALGIDGMAHRAALNVGGKTFAVLGGGADVCYPAAHKGLYKDLIKRGGILSEQPPGTPPVAWHFPARNRLISGLADVVLVMEAKEKSGSLITADMALEQGRDIYALPGMVTEPLSCGCNRLIRQGAGILLNEEDLLEELVIKGLLKKKIAIISDTKNKIKLETKENLVYSKLGLYPRGLDDLQRETGLTPQEVMGICVSLQLKGCIQERSKNYYVRAK